MERNVESMLSQWQAEAARQMPQRKLELYTKPPRMSPHRWIALSVAAVAAALVLIFVLPTPRYEQPAQPDIVCYVDGARILDRDIALEYTRGVLNDVNTHLERSSRTISKTMEHVGGLLKSATQDNEDLIFNLNE